MEVSSNPSAPPPPSRSPPPRVDTPRPRLEDLTLGTREIAASENGHLEKCEECGALCGRPEAPRAGIGIATPRVTGSEGRGLVFCGEACRHHRRMADRDGIRSGPFQSSPVCSTSAPSTDTLSGARDKRTQVKRNRADCKSLDQAQSPGAPARGSGRGYGAGAYTGSGPAQLELLLSPT